MQRQQRNRKRTKALIAFSAGHSAVCPGTMGKNKSAPFLERSYILICIKNYLLLPFVSLSRSNIRLKRSVLDNGF